MYSSIMTAMIHGLAAVPVCVEADVSDGMPQFEMVGFLSSEVRESRERVRTAIRNSGLKLPPKKITVNLTPADLRKSGNGCDLPVAAAVLGSYGFLDASILKDFLLIGEVGLDGHILPVKGVLSCVMLAEELHYEGIIVPWDNRREAAIFRNVKVLPVKTITDFLDICGRALPEECFYRDIQEEKEAEYNVDFSDISGQPVLRRASEIAASGMHNLLIIGPPGAGKSMTAQRLPTILPPLTREEKLEVAQIYSVCGLLDEERILCSSRPFRSPHHTVTTQAVTGGGRVPKPGEVSLAHKGVLFLDEMAEYDRHTLEVLREPLEDYSIRISRTGGTYEFPAEFLLVAAMNPCQCGYWPNRCRCRCSARDIQIYKNRISQPLLERLDLCVFAQEVSYDDLTSREKSENSASIRERVIRTHAIQKKRFSGRKFQYNSRIPSSEVETFCPVNPEIRQYAKTKFEEYHLSARTYYKVLRVARTIADMNEHEHIQFEDFQEALQLRSLDLNFWNV